MLLNSRLLYVNITQCKSMRVCTTSRAGSFIRPDLWPSTSLTSVISTARHVMSSSSEFISRRCTTSTNRRNDYRVYGMALKTASLTMQLSSGGIIFGHAYGKFMDTKATADSINMHSAIGHETFHFLLSCIW